MKQPASIVWMLLFVLINSTAYAQTGNKPRQFSAYPAIIHCTETELNGVFAKAPGQNISLSFSDNFHFNGTLINNVVKYNNLQSAVIRSPYFNNSIFSISRIINNDNSVSFTGRIINRDFFDGYELRATAPGNYELVKIETDRVIPDCSQQ